LSATIWLNQVEIWFSILQAKCLCDESFTSVKQLREHQRRLDHGPATSGLPR
jgi:hypothetical protein